MSNGFFRSAQIPWALISSLIAVALLALWVRTVDLDNRPFHNDEGVNYHFVKETLQKGYYPYSHENYHGPLYFYLLVATTKLFSSEEGPDEWSIKFSAVICGVFLVFLVGYAVFRHTKGDWLAGATAALLVTSSPSLVYYSRYAIHESLFILMGIWFAYSYFRFFQERSAKAVWPLALALVGLVTTKETFIITGFCTVVAALCCSRGGLALVRSFREQWALIGAAGTVFGFLVVFVFTGAFYWAEGLREMALAVPQWIARNESDIGHHKPFPYYLEILLKTEPWLLLFPTLGVFASFLPRCQFRQPLRFWSIWSVVHFLVYSFVSYKTPWLIINISAGCIVATALFAFALQPLFSGVFQFALPVSLLVLFSALSARVSYRLSFETPFGPTNPYSYVHTSAGMMDFVRAVSHFEKKRPSMHVLIGTNHYWPLPFYLRELGSRVHYRKAGSLEKESGQYDVIAVDHRTEWQMPGWQKVYYRFSDVQEANVYYRVDRALIPLPQ